MRREQVIAATPATAEENRRRIESEPLPASIAALLDAAVAAAPDAPAWIFFESAERATYREVYDATNRLANGYRVPIDKAFE